jgi:cobalt-zinc-cadmium efflux system membrane fusion protein
MGEAAADIRLPGVVEPNAYRQVSVTPLVSGRIIRVSAALGQRARQGELLAQLHSPDLADAQSRYVSARAMLDAHERELQRTQKLTEIGAASHQELERVHAEHATQLAAVATARSQLELLGVSSSAIDALQAGSGPTAAANVMAPIDGVITTRIGNVGLNVAPDTALFTIVDLSTVWIVADLYERDLSRISIGTEASITSSAYPGVVLRGRVSYVDPQVAPETRTAKLRVEVPNPRGELRLGMFVDVMLTGVTRVAVAVVPRRAIQTVADRTVVYVQDPNAPNVFIEREVRLGASSGDRAEVTAGLQTGDAVVIEGSFFLRAERERLGL